MDVSTSAQLGSAWAAVPISTIPATTAPSNQPPRRFQEGSYALNMQEGTNEPKGQTWAPRWWAVLLVGLALWIATVATAFLTGNLILLPTIVLLGSFLVPVTAVVWYLDHDPSPVLSPMRIFSAFVIAAPVGVLAAAVLESWLVYGPGLFGMLKVGFIEEFVKGAAIVLLALGIRSY